MTIAKSSAGFQVREFPVRVVAQTRIYRSSGLYYVMTNLGMAPKFLSQETVSLDGVTYVSALGGSFPNAEAAAQAAVCWSRETGYPSFVFSPHSTFGATETHESETVVYG